MDDRCYRVLLVRFFVICRVMGVKAGHWGTLPLVENVFRNFSLFSKNYGKLSTDGCHSRSMAGPNKGVVGLIEGHL